MSGAGLVAIVVVLALVGVQALLVLLGRRVRGRSVPELEPFLSEAQRKRPRLLVYFWSPTCARCRPMSKALEALGSDAVVKVNVMEALALAQAFHVMGTPSLAIVDAGTVSDVLVGARSEAQLRALLDPAA
jgi:thioredoxin-like negative regulator of GroEL